VGDRGCWRVEGEIILVANLALDGVENLWDTSGSLFLVSIYVSRNASEELGQGEIREPFGEIEEKRRGREVGSTSSLSLCTRLTVSLSFLSCALPPDAR